MENLQWRATAALVISLLVLLFWDYFLVPAPKQPVPVPQHQEQQIGRSEPRKAPPQATGEAQAPPQAQDKGIAEDSSAAPAAARPELRAAPPAHPARDVVVTTDLYRAVFTERGAKLKSFQLFKYRETVAKDSPPMELVRTTDPAQWPLGVKLLRPAVDTSDAVFTADRSQVDLRGSNPGSGEVRFSLTTPEGVRLVKRFEFRRDLYRIDLKVDVDNQTGSAIEPEPALNLASLPFGKNNGYYHQAAVLVGNDVDRVKASKLTEPRLIRGNVRWAAYDEPFFAAVVAPAAHQPVNVRLAASGQLVTESLISQPQRLPAGQQHVYSYSVFYGPKEMKILEAQDLQLGRLIDYGWFDVIAKPLMVVLNWIYDFTRNYGVAIILLTVIIKLIFWPLSQKSYRSMKEMQKLQPKLAKLKEKYKGDTAKLNQETLNLYRTYKVNPMGGCLPMLLQIPVFFALYRVLQYSIELRHAPFFLWINDLSAPDRLNIGLHIPYVGGLPVLTLLMGASMWLQQRMTPVSGDPSQAKMMQMLPLVFTFMFIYFPSGLVLYWLVNNVLSIGQQYYINNYTA